MDKPNAKLFQRQCVNARSMILADWAGYYVFNNTKTNEIDGIVLN
jgi:hypothetical protein